MLIRKLHIVKSLLTAVLAVPLLTSCYNYDGDEVEIIEKEDTAERYINLTIAVSADTQTLTRGPLGGENGDGREAGFQRENEVSGVTLILYEDAAGINTTANPPLAFVKYYPTKLVSRDAAGSPETGTHISNGDKSDLDEAVYTTGDQRVSLTDLTFGKPYHAIVVANKDLTPVLNTTKKLNDVKDLVCGAEELYDGVYGKAAYACSKFLMSSEFDFTFDLTDPTETVTNQESRQLYYRPTETNPIRIERLAARIDFWAAGATYKETGIYNSRAGYVYNVEGSTDKFVVYSITPFNLYSKGTTYGGEKLLKQLNIGYLQDETAATYVLDPSTAAKTTTNVVAFGTDGTYLNPLSKIIDDLNASTPMSAAGNPAYYQTVKAMHDKIGSQGGFGDTFDDNLGGTLKGENIIVAYPMENTLPAETTPSTPLYTYATGVAIEGDYYTGGDLTAAPTGTRVYIGYIMHQSSSTTYTPFKSNDASVKTAVPTATPMNFGIVRNNIYRISIDKISSEGAKISIKIEEEKWRHVDNPDIYI